MANFHSATFYNIYTKEEKIFIIHENIDDFNEYMKFLFNCKINGEILIGFNNINYDAQVLEYILIRYKILCKLSSEQRAELIYKISQYVISQSNITGFPPIKEWELSIQQIDLFKIWHFDNKAKRMSLKSLEFVLRMDNIEDMPIYHTQKIYSKNDIDTIISYNKHDVFATYLLYLLTIGDVNSIKEYIPNVILDDYIGKDKIQLRRDIEEEFNISCINYNDVKIGAEINKDIYCKLSNIKKWELPKKGTFRNIIQVKDCLKVPIKFESKQLQDFYNNFINTSFNPILEEKNKTKKKKSTSFNFMGLEISFGFGGIHSVDKKRILETNNEYYLTDKDCTGMYPRTIIEQQLYPKHLGPNWYKGCEYIYNERAYKYKPLSKKDKKAESFSEAFKLANNGGSFGQSNLRSSWQYDPLVAFSITIFNQFALLKLTEMLLLNKIQVVSLNTDGIVSFVGYNQKDLYEKLCKEWEVLSKHTLEETLYNKIIQTSVNDYIAIKTDGSLKFKGDFEYNKEIHKNHSMRIVPLALKEYYINNIKVEDTIYNHKDIFDFLKLSKMTGQNKLISRSFSNGEIIDTSLTKTTRYYVSNKGVSLIKILPQLENKVDKLTKQKQDNPCQINLFDFIEDETLIEKDREGNIEANYFCTIYNKHKKMNIEEYDLNYDYYINECYKVIKGINFPI